MNDESDSLVKPWSALSLSSALGCLIILVLGVSTVLGNGTAWMGWVMIGIGTFVSGLAIWAHVAWRRALSR
jgi:hypothetical protein